VHISALDKSCLWGKRGKRYQKGKKGLNGNGWGKKIQGRVLGLIQGLTPHPKNYQGELGI